MCAFCLVSCFVFVFVFFLLSVLLLFVVVVVFCEMEFQGFWLSSFKNSGLRKRNCSLSRWGNKYENVV